MEGDLKREIQLDIHAETREDAEVTAEGLREEGFGAVVGRPEKGDFWKVTVSGDHRRVEALGHRLLREMEESS